MNKNDTFGSTFLEILPGLTKVVAGFGLIAIAIFGVLPQITGTTNLNYISDSDLIREDNIIAGNAESKYAILMFIDFECSGCKAAEPVVLQIQDKYKDKVKFVYKMFPLEAIHNFAKNSAKGALAAEKQGKFSEFKEKLFLYQTDPRLTPDTQQRIAQEVGLDIDKWNTDRKSREISDRVEIDQRDGQTANIPNGNVDGAKGSVSGTPTFVFVKDGQIQYQFGNLPLAEFEAKIEAFLKS